MVVIEIISGGGSSGSSRVVVVFIISSWVWIFTNGKKSHCSVSSCFVWNDSSFVGSIPVQYFCFISFCTDEYECYFCFTVTLSFFYFMIPYGTLSNAG